MNKHTKGPWSVSHRGSHSYVFTLENDTNPVAHIYSVYGDDREANARLVSKAPELLDALTVIYNRLEAGQIELLRDPSEMSYLLELITKVKGK